MPCFRYLTLGPRGFCGTTHDLLYFIGDCSKLVFVETLVTEEISAAADVIRGGGLAAFPTETVYGLGANAFDEAAVEKIFAAKGRPSDNPLIVHIANAEQMEELTVDMNADARAFIAKFFPGPLTIVAKSSGKAARAATACLETIAFRMPANKTARELIEKCGVPLVAPSANISGRPSPTTWESVYDDLNGRIECILKGEPTEIGLESTVVDCTGEVPILLRLGAISLQELRSVVPSTRFEKGETGGETRSPGLKHKHYSPQAEVIIVESDSYGLDASGAYIGINKPRTEFALLKLVTGASQYAHEVFEFFRECDRRKIATVYCEAVAEEGIGAALMDRLRRAAEK